MLAISPLQKRAWLAADLFLFLWLRATNWTNSGIPTRSSDCFLFQDVKQPLSEQQAHFTSEFRKIGEDVTSFNMVFRGPACFYPDWGVFLRINQSGLSPSHHTMKTTNLTIHKPSSPLWCGVYCCCWVSRSRWWLQILFIFTPTWGRFLVWPIFVKGVETTN